jgi:probable rRNA maturation factor
LATDISFRNLSGCDVDLDALREAVARVVAAEGADLPALSVALVDDARIASLNQRLLGQEGYTDVIAFEAEAGEGEVIISIEAAARQAEELGHGLTEELRYLMSHGVLHVLGWDDSTPELRAAMLRRQDEALDPR